MIDPSAQVSLQIHKLLGAAGGAHDGTEITDQSVLAGRDPLSGVAFNVYRVGGVDLTTNSGWVAATALSGYQVSAAELQAGKIVKDGKEYLLTREGADPSVLTGANGVATFSKAAGAGLYLVVESLLGSTQAKNVRTGENVRLTSAAKPFFVTLPLTDPVSRDSWMYTVHVYPKNQADWITKKVQDKYTAYAFEGYSTTGPQPGFIGSREFTDDFKTVTYTLTSSITPGLTGTQMGKYEITDKLGRSSFRVPVIAPPVIRNATATGGSETLLAGDYSTWQAFKDDLGRTCDPNVVNFDCLLSFGVKLTDTGREKLAAAKAGNPAAVLETTTTIELAKTPNSVFLNRFNIDNIAYLIPNQQWAAENPGSNGLESNPVDSQYSGVFVEKYDPAAPAGPKPDLSGTEFSVYHDKTPGDGKCELPDLVGQKLIVKATITNKNPDGTAVAATDQYYNQVLITYLQKSNRFNDAEVTQRSDWVTYCLVETKAPYGYNLNPEPHSVELPELGLQNPIIRIANEKANLGNSLPLTGGEGAAVLALSGFLLIGAGLAYSVLTRRRRAD